MASGELVKKVIYLESIWGSSATPAFKTFYQRCIGLLDADIRDLLALLTYTGNERASQDGLARAAYR